MPISGDENGWDGFRSCQCQCDYTRSLRDWGLVSRISGRDSVFPDRNRRIAVAVPIPSAFAIWRQEAPWLFSCRTCPGVTLTRGRPTGFFVAVSDGVIATPQPPIPDGHRVRREILSDA